MTDSKERAPSKQENSKSVVEAAIDLSKSTKTGTWEDVVRRGTQQAPYSKLQRTHPEPESKEK